MHIYVTIYIFLYFIYDTSILLLFDAFVPREHVLSEKDNTALFLFIFVWYVEHYFILAKVYIYERWKKQNFYHSWF